MINSLCYKILMMRKNNREIYEVQNLFKKDVKNLINGYIKQWGIDHTINEVNNNQNRQLIQWVSRKTSKILTKKFRHEWTATEADTGEYALLDIFKGNNHVTRIFVLGDKYCCNNKEVMGYLTKFNFKRKDHREL